MSVEDAKRLAGHAAVNEWIKTGMKVGVGSGSTVVYVVERLVQRVKEEGLDIVCVPTSFQATQLIVEGGLKLGDLARFPELDVAIDGADEIDENMHMIKGGGGCQTQEKIVAAAAKNFVVVADYRKIAKTLGEGWKKGIPLEVVPMGYGPVMKKVEALGGKPVIRMAQNKAGPIVSDNGGMIIDADFGLIEDPVALEQKLINIPGVIETGLFIGMACKAYYGMQDGTVTTQEPKVEPKAKL